MDLKTGVILGTVMTISVAIAIILASKYQEKEIAKRAGTGE